MDGCLETVILDKECIDLGLADCLVCQQQSGYFHGIPLRFLHPWLAGCDDIDRHGEHMLLEDERASRGNRDLGDSADQGR